MPSLSILKRRPVVAAAALVCVVAFWMLWRSQSQSTAQTLVVSPTTFAEQVAVSGTVVAAHDVHLGFAESGRVSAVYVEIGSHVPRGTLLVEIDNGDLRAVVAQKRAALAVEKAGLDSLKAGTRPEQIAIDQAEVESDTTSLSQAHAAALDAIRTAYAQSDDAIHNKVDQFFSNPRSGNPTLGFPTSNPQDKITIEKDRLAIEPLLLDWQQKITAVPPGDLGAVESMSQTNLNAVAALLSDANVALNTATPFAQSASTMSGHITDVAVARTNVNTARTALTNAITAEISAKAALNTDQKNLDLARAGSTTQDLAAQEARVESAEADLASAQAHLAKTQIVSPIAGTITTMDAKVGAVIAPSDTQVSMISDGLFQIECYIPEVEIAGFSVGDTASITLDALGQREVFGAKVIAIDPAETKQNGVSTYKTTLQFDTADKRIRSGMTANMVITARSIPHALVVPQGAVFHKNGQALVQILVNGSAVDRPVELGAASSIGNVEVVSGIASGDTVILDPNTAH